MRAVITVTVDVGEDVVARKAPRQGLRDSLADLVSLLESRAVDSIRYVDGVDRVQVSTAPLSDEE